MNESLFSTYWYRVASLKPKLRNSTAVSRHVYRGQCWYVLRNRLSGSIHRFNAAAYALVGRMNGERTVQQLWDNAGADAAKALPSQDEVIRLLAQLHAADLIQSDILPSLAELFRKTQNGSGRRWRQKLANPFSVKFPLWDPDRFLERWSFLVSPLFTRIAMFAWLLIVLSAVAAAVVNWPQLSGRLTDQLVSPGNLLLLWLTFILLKILHEFGHAFAVKKWGGEVHEMGILLLALTPIPYVDATASASFPEKRHRIAVATAGIMVELLLTALALFVWLNVETGLVSALAYNVMLIGGLSTLLFNGNPLLRYDGYYALADLIEIPNLGQRATRYLGYLVQRYLLGIEAAESPVTAPGEKAWFLIYGPASGCYRLMVLIGLVWLVSTRFFIVGVLIALWGALGLFILPAVRGLARFLDNPAVRRRRRRVLLIATGAVAGLVLLFFFPIPLWTTTQGVVSLPEQSVIRAGTDCEIVEVLTPVEEYVAKGRPLLRGVDRFLEAEIAVHRAHLEELYARYNAEALHERVKRKILLEEIELRREDLRQAEKKLAELIVRSPAKGRFILIDARLLTGRFVRQGELLGYIVAEHRPVVRAVVGQDNIGLVREQVTGVEVRLAEQIDRPVKAHIERIVPAADLNLPSAALGIAGGGSIPVDPSDPQGLRAMESLFQLDLSLPEEIPNPHIGGRVYVRFEHGRMPLAHQWGRHLRQLFLRRLYA